MHRTYDPFMKRNFLAKIILRPCLRHKMHRKTFVKWAPVPSTHWHEIPVQDQFDQRILANTCCTRGRVQNSVCNSRWTKGVTLAQLIKASVGQADVQRFEPHLGHNLLNCSVFHECFTMHLMS